MQPEVVANLVTNHIHAGHTVCLTISGDSMAPALPPGSRVVIAAAAPGDLRLGDVVVVRFGQAWVIHRLVGRRWAGAVPFLFTKGDNAPCMDMAWPVWQLQGLVIAMDRGGRAVSLLSRRARWLGRLLAYLSRSQVWARASPLPDPLRWVMIKVLRLALRAAARLWP